MIIDLATTDRPWRHVYQLLIGSVNPRPIALVSSRGTDGRPNVAPFSFFNLVSGRPPVLMVCPALRRDGTPKHSLSNIRATGEFVVAVVNEAIAGKMVRCGAELPAGHDEFAFAGLTPAPAAKVQAALVAESPVNIECRLRQMIEFGDGPSAGRMILGDILAVHIADEILGPDGFVDPHKHRTVGRLGAKWYCTVTHPYELEIPEVPTA